MGRIQFFSILNFVERLIPIHSGLFALYSILYIVIDSRGQRSPLPSTTI